MRTLLLIFFFILTSVAHATPQISDTIILDGQKEKLQSDPFLALMKQQDIYGKLRPFLNGGCTASWLGFTAQWEIDEGYLYLMKVIANPCSGRSEVPLSTFFPGVTTRVLASWYTGQLRIARGAVIDWDVPLYEHYTILEIQDGKVISRKDGVPPPPMPTLEEILKR